MLRITIIVMTMILTRLMANRLMTNPSRLGQNRDVTECILEAPRYSVNEGMPNLTGQPVQAAISSISTKPYAFNCREVPSLFESQTQPPADQPRVAHMRAAENRLKVVKEQLIGQVLDVELKIHRYPLFL